MEFMKENRMHGLDLIKFGICFKVIGKKLIKLQFRNYRLYDNWDCRILPKYVFVSADAAILMKIQNYSRERYIWELEKKLMR